MTATESPSPSETPPAAPTGPPSPAAASHSGHWCVERFKLDRDTDRPELQLVLCGARGHARKLAVSLRTKIPVEDLARQFSTLGPVAKYIAMLGQLSKAKNSYKQAAARVSQLDAEGERLKVDMPGDLADQLTANRVALQTAVAAKAAADQAVSELTAIVEGLASPAEEAIMPFLQDFLSVRRQRLLHARTQAEERLRAVIATEPVRLALEDLVLATHAADVAWSIRTPEVAALIVQTAIRTPSPADTTE